MEGLTNVAEIEDSLNIASKDWNQITENAKKNGYRKGLENGANFVFQEGFNKGYKEAFQVAFTLGKFKSLLNIIPQDVKLPEHINKVLNKTRRGACNICMIESPGRNDIQKPFSQIINEQRTHSLNIIRTLHQYFQPYVKNINIDELDVLHLQNQISELPEDNSLSKI